MEQHPVPRQITTFEFKLIGFLTLKQFIYLIVFSPIGFLVYKIFPVPLLNIVLGALVVGLGVAFAFVPINDRPLDVWIRNLIKRITSPTQYIYRKQNKPIYFLQDLFFVADPHRVLAHVESQEKLNQYLAKTHPQQTSKNSGKQQIMAILQNPAAFFSHKTQTNPPIEAKKANQPTQTTTPSGLASATAQTAAPKQNITYNMMAAGPGQIRQPFFTGVIKNHKLIPLPGIMVYVKDKNDQVIRLLKTNPHGVFATFSALPQGEYIFEVKDPRSSYFFDTMKIEVAGENQKPVEIFSKELI